MVSGAVTVAGGWEAVGLWWEHPPCNVFIKWELLFIMWEQPGRLPKPKGSPVDLIWELPPCNVLNHVGAEESSLINWEQFNPSHSIPISWEPPLMSPHPEVPSSHILPKALQCRLNCVHCMQHQDLRPLDGVEKISAVVQLPREPLVKEGGLQEIALSSNRVSVYGCPTCMYTELTASERYKFGWHLCL